MIKLNNKIDQIVSDEEIDESEDNELVPEKDEKEIMEDESRNDDIIEYKKLSKELKNNTTNKKRSLPQSTDDRPTKKFKANNHDQQNPKEQDQQNLKEQDISEDDDFYKHIINKRKMDKKT